jgi:hypothetical protein
MAYHLVHAAERCASIWLPSRILPRFAVAGSSPADTLAATPVVGRFQLSYNL